MRPSNRAGRDPCDSKDPIEILACLSRLYEEDAGYHPAIWSLSEAIAMNRPGAPEVVDELLNWLGTRDRGGCKSHSAAFCVLQGSLRDMPEGAERWLVEKLQAVSADPEHPFRARDAANILGFALRDRPEYSDLIYSQQLVGTLEQGASAALMMSLRFSELIRHGERDAARAMLAEHLPAVLKLVSQHAGSFGIDRTKIFGGVSGLGEADLPLAVELIAGASDRARAENHPEKEAITEGALIAFVHCFSPRCPGLADELIKGVFSDQASYTCGAALLKLDLSNYYPSHGDPDEGKQQKDEPRIIPDPGSVN